MNLLDLAVVVVLAGAIYGGFRLGLVRRAASWIGVFAGFALAFVLLDPVMDRLDALTPSSRMLVAFLMIAALVLLGQGAGMLLGAALAGKVTGERAQRVDRIAGAALGGVGVAVALWLLIPAFVAAPGWPVRAAEGSLIFRSVDRHAPAPPKAVADLARQISAAPFPTVFEDPRARPEVGAPPRLVLASEVDERVRAATVQIRGEACNRIQDGSGFLADDGIVVTNAHVVAGESATMAIDADGAEHRASIVGFDPETDVAVLRVPTLQRTPLALGDGDIGLEGAVYGHPGGGALRAAPARIDQRIVAVGRDIYGDASAEREVFVLAAALAPGDSGAPLVAADGTVVGLAFAIDPSRRDVAYALTGEEVERALAKARSRTATVETSRCVSSE